MENDITKMTSNKATKEKTELQTPINDADLKRHTNLYPECNVSIHDLKS